MKHNLASPDDFTPEGVAEALGEQLDLFVPYRPIATAPRDATEIKLFVQQPDGRFHGHIVGHWAQDLSGEEQPAFRGWFHKLGNCSGYFEVSPSPTHWEPL